MNNEKIYEILLKLSEDVATIKTNQENLEKEIKLKPCQLHQDAIGKLETSKVIVVTVLATLSFIGGLLGGILTGAISLFTGSFKA
jgi:hypothetical protein